VARATANRYESQARQCQAVTGEYGGPRGHPGGGGPLEHNRRLCSRVQGVVYLASAVRPDRDLRGSEAQKPTQCSAPRICARATTSSSELSVSRVLRVNARRPPTEVEGRPL
jgi:hypothetical protein